MYKDKAQQKQANKEANQRYRDNKKGITKKPESITGKDVQDAPRLTIPVIPDTNDTQNVIPKADAAVIPVIPKHTDPYSNPFGLESTALIDYLEQHSINQLKSEGFWIPCWKYNGGKYPIKNLKVMMGKAN